jgi:predicted PurR-regulated permease PerM
VSPDEPLHSLTPGAHAGGPGAPDSEAPDTEARDTGAPDTGAPDTEAPDVEAPDGAGAGLLRRRRRRTTAEDMESFASRLFSQWSQLREERQEQLAAPVAAHMAVRRPEVPWGVDLAAQWSWRFLVIVAAGVVLAMAVGYLSVVVIPLVIALLIAALASPLVNGLHKVGLPRSVSSLMVVVGGLAFISALLTFAGQQVAAGAHDLAESTVTGIGQIKDWLKNGPLQASDSQIDSYLESTQRALSDWTAEGDLIGQVTEVGSAVSHVVAGLFIALFAVFFFLADGAGIWRWVVRLAPRNARPQVDSSGQVAWLSLTQFVRATVIVATVDAVGIMFFAALLQVPFVAAIGVLVFLGAFIPMVGATVAGAVAVLVALVDQGPWVAVLMLAAVLGVQFVESHGLQPFLMGRWISVHPLGVIVAIGVGALVAGVAGALVAVPLAAAVNAVGQHLAGQAPATEESVT